LLKKSTSVQHAARVEPAAVFAFDVLSVRGKDVRKLPLLKRKDIVQDALQSSQRVRAVQYVGEQGQRLYDAACGLELEGIVAKRADSPYKAGRSKDWGEDPYAARAARPGGALGEVGRVAPRRLVRADERRTRLRRDPEPLADIRGSAKQSRRSGFG
jgi:hypothetical protein